MKDDGDIDSTILDLMLRAGSHWVLWLLIGLSFAAVAVMIERLWFYIQERSPRAQIAAALAGLKASGPAAAAKQLAGAKSMEAAVVRGCLERADDGPGTVDEQRAALVETERARYEKRLTFLGTLGNNAPFVGLFGTVLGIIRSVTDLASGSMQDTQLVMAGIGQALVATGVGLVVALPAVAAYNAFMRHVESSVSAADAFAHELLAQLRAEPKPASTPSASASALADARGLKPEAPASAPADARGLKPEAP